VMVLAVVAMLAAESLHAQGLTPPSVVNQRFQGTETFKVASDRAPATALRQSIARERRRLFEAAFDRAQQPAAGTQSWASRHKKGLKKAVIIGAAIGGFVLFAVTHQRG